MNGGQGMETLIVLVLCVGIAFIVMRIKSTQLLNPNDLTAIYLKEIDAVSKLENGIYRLEFYRQSGKEYKEPIEVEGLNEALRKLKITLHKAGMNELKVLNNTSVSFAVERLFYSHGGKAEGKKLGAIWVKRIGQLNSNHSNLDDATKEIQKLIGRFDSMRPFPDFIECPEDRDKLWMAKVILDEIRQIKVCHAEIIMESFNEIEADVELRLNDVRIPEELLLAKAYDGNMEGIKLEKEGDIDNALSVYTKLMRQRVPTPHTYKRVAILAKKKKDTSLEIEACEIALSVLNSSESAGPHYQWFAKRFEKIKSKR